LRKSRTTDLGRASRNTSRVAIRTPEGTFTAEFSSVGLCALNFPGYQRRSGRLALPTEQAEPVRTWATATASALGSILAGEAPRVWPPLDLAAGTRFQQTVWKALRQIPYGETRTYGALATMIGRPQAARAVGQACGANPVPILVPCHRVQAAGGRLGGFSGGLGWKRRLLAREIR